MLLKCNLLVCHAASCLFYCSSNYDTNKDRAFESLTASTAYCDKCD